MVSGRLTFISHIINLTGWGRVDHAVCDECRCFAVIVFQCNPQPHIPAFVEDVRCIGLKRHPFAPFHAVPRRKPHAVNRYRLSVEFCDGNMDSDSFRWRKSVVSKPYRRLRAVRVIIDGHGSGIAYVACPVLEPETHRSWPGSARLDIVHRDHRQKAVCILPFAIVYAVSFHIRKCINGIDVERALRGLKVWEVVHYRD